MAAWQFEEVTEDGGVALNFESLLDESKLEKLHEVLETVAADQESEDDEMDEKETDGVLAMVTQAAAALGWEGVAPPEQGASTSATPEPGAAPAAHEAPVPAAVMAKVPSMRVPTPPGAVVAAPIPPAPTPPETTPRPARNSTEAASKAEMMMSKKQDLAKAIREQLQQAKQPAPVSPVASPLTAKSPAAPTSPAPTAGHPPGEPSPVAAVMAAVADPKKLSPAVAAATAGMSSSAAAKEILSASMKAKGSVAKPGAGTAEGAMERSIRVGFIEGKVKPINIVMLIVGTRGDVQPFIGIGLKLKEYGHRVRIASHKIYRGFVEGFGLEFYPIGGDPKVLSEYVVKHRGIMPGLDIKDALKQREQVKEILYSSWGACVQPDPENPDKPFIADAVVANPPAYGHSHCAEKLNCPLHIVFTMPWTPTKAFPSPFARIKTVISQTNSKAREVMNWLSYFAMEDLAWLGMGGMVKDFRQRVLQLKGWDKEHTSHALYHSKVPFTYIWSPSLVARPKDWPSYMEVVGFINLEVNKLTKYKPPQDLQNFLDGGAPPVYIGFGSLVVNDPIKLTQQFMDALKATGLRAIIQKGWGGLGAGLKTTPKNVFLLDGNCAHDWLFERCCAVVHHGGAGTTATGLYAGKPTFIVFFFGDQPFWGAACHSAGVGPEAVGIDDLTTPKIIDALKELILPTRKDAALRMSERMHREDGISATVDHIHRSVYGALLGGREYVWMKKERTRGHLVMPSTSIAEEGGGQELRGFMALPSKMVSSVSTMFKSNANSAAGSRAQSTSNLQAMDREAGSPASQGGKPSPPVVPRSGGSMCGGGSAKSSPQVVEADTKRKGSFSFFGC